MKPVCLAVRTQRIVSFPSRSAGSAVPSSKQFTVPLNRTTARRLSGRNRVLRKLTFTRCELNEYNNSSGNNDEEPLKTGKEEEGEVRGRPQASEGVDNKEEVQTGEGDSNPAWAASPSQSEQPLLNSQGSRLAEFLLSYQPLELSELQKDVSRPAVMAIKRVLTGTFGTLPSEQYMVTVETNREVLSGLLRSALYTGYVLRNLEYRMDLHRCYLLSNGIPDTAETVGAEDIHQSTRKQYMISKIKGLSPEVLSQLPAEAVEYIKDLESKVEESQGAQSTSTSTSVEEIEIKDQLDVMVSPYGNDLLDLLRSLDPATAKALTKPSAKGTDHAFHLVIESVLSRLYPTLTDQSAELQEEAKVTVTRDYLARILYWCMLLGNHGRGLEYKLSLEHAFEHINVDHPVGDAEEQGIGGFLGAIGSIFFGEGGGAQRPNEGENELTKEDGDEKRQHKSTGQSDKDVDELM